MLYPWQIDDYNNLVNAYLNRQFHSLILHGAVNSGREELIKQFIAYLLCHSPDHGFACGKCSSCIVHQQSNHPDLHVLCADLSEERKTLIIKVEQIRDASNFAMLSEHMSSRKVIYLPDANQLNLNSANALLKILEEPPLNCIFIMAATNLNRLLPTILSRCFKFQLKIPEYQQALEFLQQQQTDNAEFWLNYYNGEPFFTEPVSNDQLNLLQQGLLKPSIDNIFALSSELDPKKVGMSFWVDCLSKWINDLASCKLGGSAHFFASLNNDLTSLSKRLNSEKLFNFQDEIAFISEWAEHSLNHKLQLENLLFRYQQIYV